MHLYESSQTQQKLVTQVASWTNIPAAVRQYNVFVLFILFYKSESGALIICWLIPTFSVLTSAEARRHDARTQSQTAVKVELHSTAVMPRGDGMMRQLLTHSCKTHYNMCYHNNTYYIIITPFNENSEPCIFRVFPCNHLSEHVAMLPGSECTLLHPPCILGSSTVFTCSQMLSVQTFTC